MALHKHVRSLGVKALESGVAAMTSLKLLGAGADRNPPCFAKGTLILAREGYKPIEDIAVGDEVLTHLGRWRRVTTVMSRRGAALRRVRAQGVDVTTTDEHPFWARVRIVKWDPARHMNGRSFSDPRWVAAGELTKDHFLAQVLPEVKPDKRTADFWWLVGRYLADGWRVRRKERPGTGRTEICCTHAEADGLRTRMVAANFHAESYAWRPVVVFCISDNSLDRCLEPYGHLAHGKMLPGFALSLSRAKSVALLDGYMSGDGWAGPYYRQATTVSKRLAFGIALLAQRAGVVASITYVPKSKFTIIEGRRVRQKPKWSVTVPQHNQSGFIDGRHGWKLVRKSERCGRGMVYNLSVEDDESYIADGAIVCNCGGRRLVPRRRPSGAPN